MKRRDLETFVTILSALVWMVSGFYLGLSISPTRPETAPVPPARLELSQPASEVEEEITDPLCTAHPDRTWR